MTDVSALTDAPSAERFSDDVHLSRLRAAAAATGERAIDALLISPSPDYLYLLGYRAPISERLTCLVLPAEGEPKLLLPRLEEPLARHALGSLADAVELVWWDETDDPFMAVRGLLPIDTRRIGVQDQMWARFVLRLRAQVDPVELVEAGPTLSSLRRIKSDEEIDRLRAAASAADETMLAITSEPLSDRTELEVSRRIGQMLMDRGHEVAGFAIVASGPNSASPHHEPGSRRITPGDALVLDLGGTRAGYSSDTTRTAFVGEPAPEFAALYSILQEAQAAACAAVRPGIPAHDLDAVARGIITEAGYGEQFFHRTGHGIGLETHEEPYIVASNPQPLRPGHVFSVEPGIYVAGRWGARIEDIVVCTDAGGERLNTTPTDLFIVS